MATTYYHTLNGRIRGETTSGVRTNYLTDALGSVTATVNSSAAVVNTYRFNPFGGLLAKTGGGGDPRFQYFGTSSLSSAFGHRLLERASTVWISTLAHRANDPPNGTTAHVWRQYFALLDPQSSIDCNLSKRRGFAVPYKTVEFPVADLCGTWQYWRIAFDIKALRQRIGTNAEGFIIQHISFPDQVSKHCENSSKPPQGLQAFFEVWYFDKKNQLLFGDNFEVIISPFHDSWFRLDPDYSCRKGMKAQTGILKFYQADRRCAKDRWGYFSGAGILPRGDLLGGDNPPTGWNPKGGVNRRAFSSFDCCKTTFIWLCKTFYPWVSCDDKTGSTPVVTPRNST